MSDQETQQPSGEERPPKANREERHERGARDRGRRRHQPQPQSRRPEPAINLEELRELVELIAQHGFTDFELEREGIRVRLRRELAPPQQQQLAPAAAPGVQTPQSSAASAPATDSAPSTQATLSAEAARTSSAAATETSEDEGLHIITSPIVGTFYRASSPTSEPFVRLGTHVNADTVVCIIEAMKLMNEIQAETSGEVVKIYVENGQPVEYGQPIFGIKK